MNTCKIKLTTLEGYCRPNSITWILGIHKHYDSGMDSGLTALRTINIETFPLTTTNCQELWKNGRTFIRLSGEELMWKRVIDKKNINSSTYMEVL